MTPPVFHIDDEVEIIGPSIMGSMRCMGTRFKISQSHQDKECERYTADCVPWYPASSLRLVEELKIGDWVEIVGNDIFERSRVGDIFQINHTWAENGYFSGIGYTWYSAKSLRKLTPEEIQQHQSIQECQVTTRMASTIERCCERLSTIEHRQDEIEKRIDFIEAFQKDEKHEAYTTYTYKPGEEGTITVHCLCGRKHEIEATPRAYGGDLHD